MAEVIPAFSTFYGTDGRPLDGGRIFVGEAGKDPETNPIPAYWDSQLSVPAQQPVRTVVGYPYRDNAPASLYVSPENYSIRVKDQNDLPVYTRLNANDPVGDQFTIPERLYMVGDRFSIVSEIQAGIIVPNVNLVVAVTAFQFLSDLEPAHWGCVALNQTAPDARAGLNTDGFVYSSGTAGRASKWGILSHPIDARQFGLQQGNTVEGNTLAIQAAINYATVIGSRRVDLGHSDEDAPYRINNVTVGGPGRGASAAPVVLHGEGGAGTSESGTVLELVQTTGNGVRCRGNGSGVRDLEITCSPARRAALSGTDANVADLLFADDDHPNFQSECNQPICENVLVSNSGGIGVGGVGHLSGANWHNLEIVFCKGHPIVLDDGTAFDWQNGGRTSAPLRMTITGLITRQCQGYASFGRFADEGGTDPNILARVKDITLISPQFIDCNRGYIGAWQALAASLAITGEDIILINPFFSGQGYRDGRDGHGNVLPTATPNPIPNTGFLLFGRNLTLDRPRFRSLVNAGTVWGDGTNIIFPTYQKDPYPQRMIPINVHGARRGLSFRAIDDTENTQPQTSSQQSDATRRAISRVLWNSSPSLDIWVDGRNQLYADWLTSIYDARYEAASS